MLTLEMIDDLSIFKGFEKLELKKILELCTVEEYQKGNTLFCEGDAAKEMWIVKEGGDSTSF